MPPFTFQFPSPIARSIKLNSRALSVNTSKLPDSLETDRTWAEEVLQYGCFPDASASVTAPLDQWIIEHRHNLGVLADSKTLGAQPLAQLESVGCDLIAIKSVSQAHGPLQRPDVHNLYISFFLDKSLNLDYDLEDLQSPTILAARFYDLKDDKPTPAWLQLADPHIVVRETPSKAMRILTWLVNQHVNREHLDDVLNWCTRVLNVYPQRPIISNDREVDLSSYEIGDPESNDERSLKRTKMV
ncbi:hypothetical protein CPB83DRAFT_897845 [Crepidotus variabilis]|uniref:Uncharacterized protein n=1 Tax=Crepidotus variabilis TaxID=179855 RepID=A0A9P6JKP1_9AGAR|nr:hypothetical protein CPB83DRAFT_897845 [Crepidotus variabilis]